MLGPAVGGLLARPAQNWGAFKDVRLFLWFPYLLSCVPAAQRWLPHLMCLRKRHHENGGTL